MKSPADTDRAPVPVKDDVALERPRAAAWTSDHATIAALLETTLALPKVDSLPESRL